MNLFESLINNSEEGMDLGKKYAITSYKYSKLKLFQILTYSISTIIKILFIGSLILSSIIFLAVAGAIAVGDYFKNPSLGYLIVGGSLFLLSLFFLFLRNRIDKKVISKIANLFFESNE